MSERPSAEILSAWAEYSGSVKKLEEKLSPLINVAQNRCFGCGPANTGGLRLEFLVAEDGSVVARPTISDGFEGPVGCLHGGIIATLLDESMSKAVRRLGVTAVTRQLEIEYLRPVPSGEPIRLEGRLVRSENRRHWAEARIVGKNDATLATGKGMFVEVRASRFKAIQPSEVQG